MHAQPLADPPKVSFSDCLDQEQLVSQASLLLPQLFQAVRSRVFFWSSLAGRADWPDWEMVARFEQMQSALHEAQISL
jgi:hypothetical protein